MGAPPLDATTGSRLQRYIEEELRAAATYRALAQRADGRPRKTLERLAAGEERHARAWMDICQQLGIAVPEESARAARKGRALAWFASRAGLTAVVPLLERHEGAEVDRYAAEEHAPPGIVAEEREHAELLSSLAPAWRARASASVRAGTFGVSDGLVSNLALVMGVFAATSQPSAVVIAGVAGLLAGALSMAVGEFVSVASQREMLVAGLAGGEAGEAIGQPSKAALTSFTTFTVGAAVPLLPFLVASGTAAAVTALLLTGLALYGVGAAITLLTLRPGWRSGGRQLLLGYGAAAATYGIGSLLGVAVA